LQSGAVIGARRTPVQHACHRERRRPTAIPRARSAGPSRRRQEAD